MAEGRRSDSARDGQTPQDQRRVCRVPGGRKTITERDRDRALLEIHPAMKPRHAAALVAIASGLLLAEGCMSQQQMAALQQECRAGTGTHANRLWHRTLDVLTDQSIVLPACPSKTIPRG